MLPESFPAALPWLRLPRPDITNLITSLHTTLDLNFCCSKKQILHLSCLYFSLSRCYNRGLQKKRRGRERKNSLTYLCLGGKAKADLSANTWRLRDERCCSLAQFTYCVGCRRLGTQSHCNIPIATGNLLNPDEPYLPHLYFYTWQLCYWNKQLPFLTDWRELLCQKEGLMSLNGTQMGMCEQKYSLTVLKMCISLCWTTVFLSTIFLHPKILALVVYLQLVKKCMQNRLLSHYSEYRGNWGV